MWWFPGKKSKEQACQIGFGPTFCLISNTLTTQVNSGKFGRVWWFPDKNQSATLAICTPHLGNNQWQFPSLGHFVIWLLLCWLWGKTRSMTRVCNSPGTRFHPRFGNKILEMHHLFPTLPYPIRKGRRFSILFLYLLIKLSAISYLLNLCTTSFPSHSILQACTTRNPPKHGCTPGPFVSVLFLSYAPVLGSVLHLCLISVLCSVWCLCLPVTVLISPLS